MSEDPKNLVRTAKLTPESATRLGHPLNPNADVLVHRLGDRVGMKRAHLSIARLPPGRESFVPHSHTHQEEFLFILSGEGTALIGDARVAVGPGDYMGFPTDGTPHQLINSGVIDLVYLMGGERSDAEVVSFPTLGKTAFFSRGEVNLFDPNAAIRLSVKDWVKPG